MSSSYTTSSSYSSSGVSSSSTPLSSTSSSSPSSLSSLSSSSSSPFSKSSSPSFPSSSSSSFFVSVPPLGPDTLIESTAPAITFNLVNFPTNRAIYSSTSLFISAVTNELSFITECPADDIVVTFVGSPYNYNVMTLPSGTRGYYTNENNDNMETKMNRMMGKATTTAALMEETTTSDASGGNSFQVIVGFNSPMGGHYADLFNLLYENYKYHPTTGLSGSPIFLFVDTKPSSVYYSPVTVCQSSNTMEYVACNAGAYSVSSASSVSAGGKGFYGLIFGLGLGGILIIALVALFYYKIYRKTYWSRNGQKDKERMKENENSFRINVPEKNSAHSSTYYFAPSATPLHSEAMTDANGNTMQIIRPSVNLTHNPAHHLSFDSERPVSNNLLSLPNKNGTVGRKHKYGSIAVGPGADSEMAIENLGQKEEKSGGTEEKEDLKESI